LILNRGQIERRPATPHWSETDGQHACAFDAHQHFWDPGEPAIRGCRRPAGSDPEAVQSGLTCAGARGAADLRDRARPQTISSLDETREFLELATRWDFIWGVVGWVDL